MKEFFARNRKYVVAFVVGVLAGAGALGYEVPQAVIEVIKALGLSSV
jgi:hypothetical protein